MRPAGPAEAEHLTSHAAGDFAISALDPATFGPLLLAVERALWSGGKPVAIARRPPEHVPA